MPAAEIFVEVSGKDVGLSALLTRLEAEMRKTDQAGLRLGQTLGGGLASNQQRASSSTLSLAQAQARLDVTQGNTVGGVQRLTTALAGQSTTTVQTVNAQRQLLTMQNQLDGSTKTLASSMQGLNSTFGAFGITLGAGALLRLGGEALSAANNLEKTEATVRALSGSSQRYAEVLLLAQHTQTQFGGSLEENLRGLGSLVNLSNRASVSLGQLNNIAQRLALVDPLQGIEGAQIALKEFFSGDITSLARRFELPRQELNALKDTSISTADKMKGLDDLLNRQGITSEILAARTRTAAATFDQLGAQASNAGVQVGKLIQDLLKIPAKITTEILIKVSGGLDALTSADAKLEGVQARLLQVSNSFADYGQKLAFANSQLAPFGAQVGGLTQQQFEFGQSLIKSGVSAADAMAKIREFGDVIQAGSLANQDWGASSSVLINRMIAISQGSAEGKAAVDGLVAAYQLGGLSSERFAGAISVLEAQQERARQAAAEEARENRLLAGSHDEAAKAAQQAANAEQVAAIDAQTAGVAHAQLAQAAQNGANALLSAGAAGASEAARLARSSSLVDVLTAAFYRLAAAKAAASVDIASGRPEAGGDAIARSLGAAGRNQAFFAVQTERANEAQKQQILQTGSHAQKVSALTAEYERQRRIFGATSAEAINAQTKLISETDKATKASRAGGAAKLSDQTKLNNQLLAGDTRFANQEEDADAKHQKKLLDIEEEFQRKRIAAQAAFDQDKLDTRAGFYEQLGSVEEHGLQIAMSQKFEAAAKEANEIAKTQGADAAEKFLDAARAAIEKEGQLQAEIDKAKKEGDKDKAEFLTGVLKLQQQADQARLDSLRKAGSDAANERDKQLADENKAYSEAQNKIITASDRATEAQITNAERAGKKIDETNLKYERQAGLLDRIGARAGTPSSAAQVPPAETGGATPGTLDLGSVVSKLDAIVSAVNSAKDAISSAVERDTREVGGAVRGLQGRLVN